MLMIITKDVEMKDFTIRALACALIVTGCNKQGGNSGGAKVDKTEVDKTYAVGHMFVKACS